PVGPREDRLKQIGGPRQIRQSQVEEQILGQLRAGRALGNVAVVIGAVLDGMVEDCRIRGQPGHRKFLDVALQRAAVHQVAGDIVEPEALTEVVQCLRRFHRVDSRLAASIGAVYRACDTSAVGKAATTMSKGKRSAESASFRTPVTLEALGDPVTYSLRVSRQ